MIHTPLTQRPVNSGASKWKKHEQKTSRKNSPAAETSLSERMSQARTVGNGATTDDGTLLSPRQRMDARHPNEVKPEGAAANPWAQRNAVAAPQRTNAGLVEDDSVKQARQAMIDAGEAPGTQQAQAVRPEVDKQTKEDLLLGFSRRTREFEAGSKWNCVMLERALEYATETLGKPWSAATFDWAFNLLVEHNCLEFTYGERAHIAPVEFVVPGQSRQQKQDLQKLRTGKAGVKLVAGPDYEKDKAAARRMEFDTLASTVRSEYRGKK